MRLKVIISLLLAGITLAIYWPASHFTFIYYDDPFFILCPQVAAGLSPVSIDWVLKGVVAENWHPITTFSFLLMHELYGVNPGAEHLLNIFFHATNAVLLFWVLVEMTGSRVQSPESTGNVWCCAIVAAIFAWHPLRVESVAWISERKDVLFAFFMLLSLLCYAWYARSSRENSPSAPLDAARTAQRAVPTLSFPPSRNACYNLALLFFILGFMSKATIVTLPFLLLLLDYWPLQRLNPSTLRSLLFEKIRFFALAAIFCVLTFWIHKTHADIQSLQNYGIGMRVENTILSYVNYLGKLFWPANLTVLYPYPQSFDIAQVSLAALLLLAISAFCILQISRRPYLAAGWFWYLASMIPVIGLVQIGDQAMADRHTYISLIGPVMAVVWLIWEWVRSRSFWKYLALSVIAIVLAVCAVLTERQLQFWKDTVTLFSRTIAITPDNGAAEFPLALGLEHDGFFRQAAVQYRIGLTLPPASMHYDDHFYLAEAMAHLGQYRDAVVHLEAALQINPHSTDAMNNLAWTLATCPDAKVRNGARAVPWAEHACELTHDQNPVYLTTLAAAYAEAGRFDDAVNTTQKAIALADQYGMDALYAGNQELLQTYSAHQTYAQTHPAPPAGQSP